MTKDTAPKGIRVTPAFRLGLTVFLALSPLTVNATPITLASVGLLGYNQLDTSLVGGAYVEHSYNFNGSPIAVTNSTHSFSGLDVNNNEATMTVTYSGQAQSSTTALKVSAQASLANAFRNDQNSPFVINDNLDTDPNGIPEEFGAESYASLSDTLIIQGAADLSYITLDFHVDGSIGSSNTGANGYFCVESIFFCGYAYDDGATLQPDGSWAYDQTFTTSQMLIHNGTANLSLALIAGISLSAANVEGGPASALQSASSDFFNTLTLGDFSGFNSNGEQVDLVNVTGSSGEAYGVQRVARQPTSVPEPATLALMALGLTAMGFARKRHHQR